MKKSDLGDIVFSLLALVVLIFLPSRNLFGKPSPQQPGGIQQSEYHQPVYFVRIFGGDFPIPASYELNVSAALDTSRAHLEFGSPANPLLDNPLKFSTSNVGFIAIGSYREYVKKDGQPFSNASAIQNTKCFGLTVLIAAAMNKKLQRLGYTSVFIHDNDEYLEIDAVNDDLWKSLIKRFGKTVEKPAGRDCLIRRHKTM